MIVSEFFKDLSHGELSNLSLSNGGNGSISTEGRPKVLLYTNDGLLRLYTKFVLKETDLLVQLHKHITFYHLIPRFAVNYVSASGEDDEELRYLVDLPQEKFLGDVIRVLSVYHSDGYQLPLNDIEQPLSVFTPQHNILQVPNPSDDVVLNVSYQARHPKLTGDMDEWIELPDVLFGALRAYVAYSAWSHMNTQDSSSKAQEHLAIYENLCDMIKDGDLVGTSTSTSNTRFDSHGWI